MKPSGDHLLRHPRSQVGCHGMHQLSGPLLELDSRLALVVDLVPDPEDRRDGVEQPSCAGSQRRVHAAIGHRQHRVPLRSRADRPRSGTPVIAYS